MRWAIPISFAFACIGCVGAPESNDDRPQPEHLGATLEVDALLMGAAERARDEWALASDGLAFPNLVVSEKPSSAWSIRVGNVDKASKGAIGYTFVDEHSIVIDLERIGEDERLLDLTVLHELGHFFGLGHSDAHQAVMFRQDTGQSSLTDLDRAHWADVYE
jgi:hypothetical protein